MRHSHFDIPEFVTQDPARQRLKRYHRLKRKLDIAGVVLLAPLALPVIGLLWLLVRMDGGPGFFGHQRVGRDGIEFKCWKLRSMVPDAEAALRAHLRQNRAAAREWAENYKLREDPRVTRIGRFLRRSSLDELPQLWNVLKGEMSLVGPRPVPRDELAEYQGAMQSYLALRPGLTGLWQVSGRNDLRYADRVALDRDYAQRAGPMLDLLILGKTFGVVMRRSGL